MRRDSRDGVNGQCRTHRRRVNILLGLPSGLCERDESKIHEREGPYGVDGLDRSHVACKDKVRSCQMASAANKRPTCSRFKQVMATTPFVPSVQFPIGEAATGTHGPTLVCVCVCVRLQLWRLGPAASSVDQRQEAMQAKHAAMAIACKYQLFLWSVSRPSSIFCMHFAPRRPASMA
jgi:hypothetical protein